MLVHLDDLRGVDDRDVGRQRAGDPAERRLVADQDQPVVGMGAGEVEDARDDLGGAVVAAHRVDGDADAVDPRLGWGGSRLRHRISARRRRRRA